MNIDAAKRRCPQHPRWQNQPVRHHDHQIGVQLFQSQQILLGSEVARLQYRQVMLQRQLLDRTRGKLASAPGGSVGLSVDRNDLMFRLQQRQQRR